VQVEALGACCLRSAGGAPRLPLFLGAPPSSTVRRWPAGPAGGKFPPAPGVNMCWYRGATRWPSALRPREDRSKNGKAYS
jgi:hypothetical protein